MFKFYDNNTLDKIHIETKSKKINKYYPIYCETNSKLYELYVKTPKLQLMFDPKYKTIKFKLHPLTKSMENFINLIKKIERNIKKHCKENISNCKFKSCIDTTNIYNSIVMTINNNCKIKNNNNEIIEVDDLKQNQLLKMIINIPYFYNTNNKVGISINISTIKTYSSINDYNSFDFIDASDDEEIIFPKNKQPHKIYQCMNCSSEFIHYKTPNSSHITSSHLNKQPPPPPPPPPPSSSSSLMIFQQDRFTPSSKELLLMRNKLNKVKVKVN
jgi:hypothetical protein